MHEAGKSMFQTHCYYLVCVLVLLTKLDCIKCTRNAGPVGEVKLFYVNECEPPIEEEMTLESNLETVDYEEKALNFKLILPFDVDDTFNFELIADKWVDGDWQEGTYKTDGALFDFIKDYIPVIWGNLRNACEPKIEEEYYIKAGEYELKKFQEIAENIEFPQILYGRFRVTLYLIKDEKNIACRLVEAESIAN